MTNTKVKNKKRTQQSARGDGDVNELVQIQNHPPFGKGPATNQQGGIKCGNPGTGFLDSEGSHR